MKLENIQKNRLAKNSLLFISELFNYDFTEENNRKSKHFLVAMLFCSTGICYSNHTKGIDQNAWVAMVA